MKTQSREPRRGGFTLIETAFSVMIIGLSVVAMVQVFGQGSRTNDYQKELSQATFLAQEIREMTAGLPLVDPQTGDATFGPEEVSVSFYDDIDDFRSITFSPPRDSNRNVLSSMAGWSQRVTVHSVFEDNVKLPSHADVIAYYFDGGPAPYPPNGTTSTVRVAVDVFHNGRLITTQSWLVTAGDPVVE